MQQGGLSLSVNCPCDLGHDYQTEWSHVPKPDSSVWISVHAAPAKLVYDVSVNIRSLHISIT